MKLILKKGVTSQTALLFIQDKTQTDGRGLAGLAFNTATLTWYYYREGQGTGGTAVTLATQTLGTWASGGFVEVDATDMPGWYEIGIPDAALATGADFVGMQLKGGGNMAQVNLEIELVNVDLADGVRMGLTALPSAAADAAGGLPISDAGGLDLDAKLANTNEVTAARMGALTDWINGGRLDLILDIIAADTTTDIPATLATIAAYLDTEIADIQARLPAALSAGGNMKSDALAISGSTAAADALEESTESIGYGTVDGTGATTTTFLTSAITPDSVVNDQFNGRVLIFKADTTTTALRGQATTISDWAHTSAEIGTFTVVALTTAPQTGDTFSIL